MIAPVSLSEDTKRHAKKLVWQAACKFVLAATGAVGAKLGERLVEWVFGEEPDEDDDEEDPGEPVA